MSNLEQRLRDRLGHLDPGRPAPANPVRWVAPRVAAVRRNRVVAAVAVAAVLAAGGAALSRELLGRDIASVDVGPVKQPGLPSELPPQGVTEVGPAQVTGARTGTTDASRLLVFVAKADSGSALLGPNETCWRGARLAADETAQTVTLRGTVLAAKPVPGRPLDCRRDSFGAGSVAIGLDAPLGDRRLVDGGTGETVPVFDGSALLVPTYLPPGWRLIEESYEVTVTPRNGEPSRAYTQGYFGPDGYLSVSQHPVDATLLPGPVVATVDVSGHAAQVHEDTQGSGNRSIGWSVGEAQVSVFTGGESGPALDKDTLVRIARSMRTGVSPEQRGGYATEVAARLCLVDPPTDRSKRPRLLLSAFPTTAAGIRAWTRQYRPNLNDPLPDAPDGAPAGWCWFLGDNGDRWAVSAATAGTHSGVLLEGDRAVLSPAPVPPAPAPAPTSREGALALCRARPLFPGQTVVDAFPTTTGAITRRELLRQPADRRPPEPLPVDTDGEPAAYCWVDGEVPQVVPPGNPNYVDPPYDRALYTVSRTGKPRKQLAGYAAALPVSPVPPLPQYPIGTPPPLPPQLPTPPAPGYTPSG